MQIHMQIRCQLILPHTASSLLSYCLHESSYQPWGAGTGRAGFWVVKITDAFQEHFVWLNFSILCLFLTQHFNGLWYLSQIQKVTSVTQHFCSASAWLLFVSQNTKYSSSDQQEGNLPHDMAVGIFHCLSYYWCCFCNYFCSNITQEPMSWLRTVLFKVRYKH